ncbi:fibropellin-1-like [Branchiostoma floridae]|uniref:Fibropellin-1-like n=2 Tax=Branchiostoma floridae TaxID=7739 RepID=A0A9J7HLL9_BRAFL|nr:fibropellin-1-like [Branchiostoma floridae]
MDGKEKYKMVRRCFSVGSITKILLCFTFLVISRRDPALALTVVNQSPLMDPINTSYIKCVTDEPGEFVTFSAVDEFALPQNASTDDISPEEWPGKMMVLPPHPDDGYNRLGTYNCASFTASINTVKMPADASVRPEVYTKTFNAGEEIELKMNEFSTPSGASLSWDFNGEPLVNSFASSEVNLRSATSAESGTYHCYHEGYKEKGALTRVIVRDCAAGKWGPGCFLDCSECYNGGWCDDKTGQCVCPPGFYGETCDIACGPGRFGYECRKACDDITEDVAACMGKLFCVPDPFGCACIPGFTGIGCNEPCPRGTYGASCTQTCRCRLNLPCDAITGECPSGCADGYMGPSCQKACMVDNGVTYQGPVSTTESGYTCQRWDSQNPWQHGFNVDRTPMLQENYCRNPDNEPRPWCYTTSFAKRWEYCNIDRCEDVDNCSPETCQNGGSCRNGFQTFLCVCPRGYIGVNCETDIDECDSDPCQNGGTCVDNVGFYECQCLEGFYGQNCEEETNECLSEPCENGGTCLNTDEGLKCACVDGFTGTFCETEIDECLSDPCMNGGTCYDFMNYYVCDCRFGFAGDHCEDELEIDYCLQNQCQNSARCVSGNRSYMCLCSIEYTGDYCEQNLADFEKIPTANIIAAAIASIVVIAAIALGAYLYIKSYEAQRVIPLKKKDTPLVNAEEGKEAKKKGSHLSESTV